ncbi:MAG: hypothetical protein GKR90_06940 [Pseudomonadales bacterium]|nr:hypothetical protein [Pseudomonadales bacterium]
MKMTSTTVNMCPIKVVRTLIIVIAGLSNPWVHAFDMSATLEVGGWQEREEITYNAKGKVMSINQVWVGIVEREEIAGIPHVWMEMRTQVYKENRKGERKAKGELAVMKTSIEESALTNFDEPFSNMRSFAKDTIIKNGNNKPMRLRAGGVIADMMLKAFGANIEFSLVPTGTVKSIQTRAGSFDAEHYKGTGSVDMRVLIRRIHIDSEMDTWLSENVPLGVVKQEIVNTQGKKITRVTTELLDHGTGATSSINNSDAQDMPGFNLLNQ